MKQNNKQCRGLPLAAYWAYNCRISVMRDAPLQYAISKRIQRRNLVIDSLSLPPLCLSLARSLSVSLHDNVLGNAEPSLPTMLIVYLTNWAKILLMHYVSITYALCIYYICMYGLFVCLVCFGVNVCMNVLNCKLITYTKYKLCPEIRLHGDYMRQHKLFKYKDTTFIWTDCCYKVTS